MAMFTFTLQDVELLFDCVTQSRGFKDFEKRGVEDLQASIMEMKNDLAQLHESGSAGASMVVWNTKNPEPKRKMKKNES